MSIAQPLPPHNANRPYAKRISTDNAEESTQTLLDTPEKEKLPHLPLLPHSGLSLKSVLKITLVLILATSYLTFCVIAHYRPIPIGSKEVVGLPFFHFSTASGITTIAILIIYVALWPIKGVVDEIRSEEFFRLLRTHPKGVPLDSVNAISVPTTGAFDIALATFHRHCSPLLTSTLVITLLIAATSVLAPAALNAASILTDAVDPTFQIGAIPDSSYYYKLDDSGGIGVTNISDFFPLASAVTWVENVLNLTTAYSRVISSEDDPLGYVVPFPPDYTPAMQAQWTTDVIVFDPSCNWRVPNITGVLDFNSTETQSLRVTLLETNLTIFIIEDYFGGYDVAKTSIGILYNYTRPSDGSTVFVLSQPTISSEDGPQVVDLSKVPTLRFSDGNNTAFLVCSPHVSIQTRQVLATGNGILTLGEHQPRQGNLDLNQVNLLLMDILSYFATSSGPSATFLGTDMMIQLLFGNGFQFFVNFLSVPPAPLTNITNVYKQAIQSAAKVFVGGKMGVANVTGGYFKEQVVFKSSLGHVIASAILFALLTIGFVVAQFREGRDGFTLVDVAAALADSDAPQKFVEMKQGADAGERRILRFDQSDKGDWFVRLGASAEE